MNERERSFAVVSNTPRVVIDKNNELPPPFDVVTINDEPDVKNDFIEFFIDEPPNTIKHVNWNRNDDIENRFFLLEKRISILENALDISETATVVLE